LLSIFYRWSGEVAGFINEAPNGLRYWRWGGRREAVRLEKG